jgi:hypothetical protein
MSSFLAGADATACAVAGNKVGLPDEYVTGALVNFPGAVWDAGVAPTSATDLQWAVREAFRLYGVKYAERADQFVAQVPTGLRATVTVPNIVGTQRVAAELALTLAGCRPGTATGAANAAPVGQVLTQATAAGANQVGKAVNYTYSLGT